MLLLLDVHDESKTISYYCTINPFPNSLRSTRGQKGDRNPRKKYRPEEQDLSEMSKFRYKQHLTMDECNVLMWGFDDIDDIQSVDVDAMRSFIDMNLPDMDSSNKKALLKAVGEGDIAWWDDMRDGMQRMPQGMVIQNKTASNNNRLQSSSMSMMPPGAQGGYAMSMYQPQGYDRQGYTQTYSNNPYGMHPNRFVPQAHQSYIPPPQYAMGGYPGAGDQGGGDGKVPGGNGPPEDGLLGISSHGSKKKSPPPPSNRKKKTKGGAAKRSREEDTNEEEEDKEDKKQPAKKEGKKLPAKKAGTKKVKKEQGGVADDDSSSDSSEDDEVEVGVKRPTRQGGKKGDQAYGSDMEEVENSSFGLIHCVFKNKLDAQFELFHNNAPNGGNRDPITVVASEMNDNTQPQARYTGTTVWSPTISTKGEKWSWSSIRSDYQKKFLITYVKKISGIGKGVGQSNKIKVSEGEHLENQLPPRGANMPETISIFQGPLNSVQPMIRYRNVDNCDIPIPGNCMMVGTKNKAYSCSCSSHPAGCGPHLELGQDVLVYGPNIRHLVGGVYRIGCHVLLPGRRIGCKVGYVRVMYEQLHLFVNRVGTVTYIAPEPSTKRGGKAYDALYKECVGYCHLSFFQEGEGFVRNPANRKRGGWEYLELPTKEGLDQKGQGTKG